MSQHDFNLENADGAAFRANLNNALAAVVTLSSGPDEPSTTFAYQLWHDTSTSTLKQRNAANNAWVDFFGSALANAAFGPFTDIASGATTDLGDVTTVGAKITGTTTITSFGTGASLMRIIKFGGSLTLTHNATSLILPGAANITTAAGDTAIALSDVSGNWTVVSYERASGKPVAAIAASDISAAVLAALNFGPFTDIASAATTDLSSVVTIAARITGTTTITSFGSGAKLLRLIKFSAALTLTHNATSLILPGGASITTAAGDTAIALSDVSGNWTVVSYERASGRPLVNPPTTLPGAVGLIIQNNSITPNSKVDVDADHVVMIDSNGVPVFASSVDVTIDTSTTGVNGLDTGARANSTWYHIWLISNGSTTAGLASTSATSPTLPSGYTFKVRLGAMLTNSSGNFMRTIQKGQIAHYKVASGSTTTALPEMISGSSGSVSTPTWTAVAVAPYVPQTAISIKIALHLIYTGAITLAMAAPNNSYGAYSSTSNSPPCVLAMNNATDYSLTDVQEFLLETTDVYYAANTAGAELLAVGWRDKVNAS